MTGSLPSSSISIEDRVLLPFAAGAVVVVVVAVAVAAFVVLAVALGAGFGGAAATAALVLRVLGTTSCCGSGSSGAGDATGCFRLVGFLAAGAGGGVSSSSMGCCLGGDGARFWPPAAALGLPAALLTGAGAGAGLGSEADTNDVLARLVPLVKRKSPSCSS